MPPAETEVSLAEDAACRGGPRGRPRLVHVGLLPRGRGGGPGVVRARRVPPVEAGGRRDARRPARTVAGRRPRGGRGRAQHPGAAGTRHGGGRLRPAGARLRHQRALSARAAVVLCRVLATAARIHVGVRGAERDGGPARGPGARRRRGRARPRRPVRHRAGPPRPQLRPRPPRPAPHAGARGVRRLGLRRVGARVAHRAAVLARLDQAVTGDGRGRRGRGRSSPRCSRTCATSFASSRSRSPRNAGPARGTRSACATP